MELTLENVYHVLESTEYTVEFLTQTPKPGEIEIDKFKLSDFEKTIRLLLDSFFPDYKIRNVEPPTMGPMAGGMVHFDSQLGNKLFRNITEFSFVNFYPSIITKLSDYVNKNKENDPYGEEEWEDDFFSKNLYWNINEFPILYKFLLDNKKNIKKMSAERDPSDKVYEHKVYILTRILLNYTYGAMNNHYSFLRCNNRAAVPDTGRNIMQYLLDRYRQYIIYLDTDSIWFSAYSEIKEDFENKLKELDMPYDIEDHFYFLLVHKKNYLIIDEPRQIKFIGTRGTIENLREWHEKQEKIREANRKKIEERRKTESTLDSIWWGD